MNSTKTLDVLNSLLQINNDRVKGYETAVKETDDTDLKVLLQQFVHTSQLCKKSLVEEISHYNGIPTESTKITGDLFRVWMDLKAAFTAKDKRSILKSCEYGETIALETYHSVIISKVEDMTTEQQILIESQYKMIRADYARIRTLRDALV